MFCAHNTTNLAFQVKVDDERFLDIPNMLQRRYDDKSKVTSIGESDSN